MSHSTEETEVSALDKESLQRLLIVDVTTSYVQVL